MRSLAIPVALLSLTPLLCAQEEVTPPEPSGAEAALAALNAEYKAAEQKFFQQYVQLANKDQFKARKFYDDPANKPQTTFQPRYLEAAQKYTGTEAAVPFLLKAVEYLGSRDTALEALDLILEHHTASPALETSIGQMARLREGLGEDMVKMTLDTLLEESPHAKVKAAALFAHGQLKMETAPDAALELMRKSLATAADGAFAAEAGGIVFEKENLQVGMKAPDIVAKDIDGVEFKLSDYAGKVVMLDFWGDW